MNRLPKLLLETNGSSLIQVMFAAAIMMVIALGLSSMISNQNKEIKAIGEKLLTKELESQMKTMLGSSDYCNCLLRGKTFDIAATPPVVVPADQITRLQSGYSTGPLDALPCTPIATDFISPAGGGVAGSNMTVASVDIRNMQLVSPANYKADVQVSFSNSVRVLQPIKSSIQFAVDGSGAFVRCSGGASALTPLNPGAGYDGMTGDAACASIGKRCQYVSSLNTIWHDAGCPGATHCMRVCMTWYNQNLPGVPDVLGKTNIHSCAAQVGGFTTYLHPGVVRCGGYFSAFCQ